MIEVLIEVASGAATSKVAIRAESLLRAVDAAKERYRDADVRVIFPLSPEEFFVKDRGAAERDGGAEGGEEVDERLFTKGGLRG